MEFFDLEMETRAGDDEAGDSEAGEKTRESEECEASKTKRNGDVSLHAERAGGVARAVATQIPRYLCSRRLSGKKHIRKRLIMAEIEPELHWLGKEGFALQNLPNRSEHLEEAVDGNDRVRSEDEAKTRVVEPRRGALGARGVGGHENCGRKREAECGKAEEEDESVETTEFLL